MITIIIIIVIMMIIIKIMIIYIYISNIYIIYQHYLGGSLPPTPAIRKASASYYGAAAGARNILILVWFGIHLGFAYLRFV
jgi:hypothetical protein